METLRTKILLTVLILVSVVWLAGTTVQNIASGGLLEFGTVEFKKDLSETAERSAYGTIAQCGILRLISYPLVILFSILYLRSTRRRLKENGWLVMSAVLLFLFIPVECYCLWKEWKMIGLQYWGTWPVEEFRKALLSRITALAGLPLIASLCYYTIILLVIVQPMKKKEMQLL